MADDQVAILPKRKSEEPHISVIEAKCKYWKKIERPKRTMPILSVLPLLVQSIFQLLQLNRCCRISSQRSGTTALEVVNKALQLYFRRFRRDWSR
jgi:hypothetical protein